MLDPTPLSPPSPSVPPATAARAPEPPTPVRVAAALVATLERLGIDLVFGVPGGAISPMYDALLDAPGMQVVYNRHESGAVFAAAGAARAGRMACVLVTSGPGVTNALTGLASARLEGAPLVLIGGEVPVARFGTGALQEGSPHAALDVARMVAPAVKHAEVVVRPDAAVAALERAVALARTPPCGPVFLSLPLDVATARVFPARAPVRPSPPPRPADAEIDEAVARLATRRGVLLVGSGCRAGSGPAAVRALAERLQWPVVTTPKAKGAFPESHPLSLGVLGYGGHPGAEAALAEGPDVLLVLGSSLGESTGPAVSAPVGAVVQVDVDASRIGRARGVTQALVGDVAEVADRLLTRLPVAPPRPPRGPRATHPIPATEGLHPAIALRALQAALPRDARYTVDIGEHLLYALHHLEIDAPDGFASAIGLGSMGSGPSTAVGLAVADPGRPTVSICGDFGFQMAGTELATCVQHGLGVVFVVLQDARMGMVEAGFQRVYRRSLGVEAPWVDFAAIARAQGAVGRTVHAVADLAGLAELARGDRPVVVDIRISPTPFPVSGRDATLGTFAGRKA